MNTYTVTSHNLAGHDHGDTVTDDDLEGANVPALIAGGHLGANVPALIAGGHLAEAKPKNSRKAKTESEAD
jgi:hypothetical protein